MAIMSVETLDLIICPAINDSNKTIQQLYNLIFMIRVKIHLIFTEHK